MTVAADILLAVPTRGQIDWATVTRLEEIHARAGLADPILYQPGNLSVALTRNRIVRRFLAGNWKVLAMCDDDVIPPPHWLDTATKLPDSGLAMIATPHPMPVPDGSSLMLSIFDGRFDALRPVAPRDGLHRCAAVATGAVVIAREPLEALAGQGPFRIENDPEAPITSDDFLFCADLAVNGYAVGYWFDGSYANHHSAVGLAQLLEGQSGRRALRSVA